MSFKNNLMSIKNTFDHIKDESKNSCIEKRIDKKLNLSLEKYMENIRKTTNYLLSRSSYKVLKAISKQKNKNKEEK